MKKTLLLTFLYTTLFSVSIFGQEVPDYDLPELLVSNNGTAIDNSEDWKNIRRPEILALF